MKLGYRPSIALGIINTYFASHVDNQLSLYKAKMASVAC